MTAEEIRRLIEHHRLVSHAVADKPKDDVLRHMKPFSCCLMADALEALLPIVEELAHPKSKKAGDQGEWILELHDRARDALT